MYLKNHVIKDIKKWMVDTDYNQKQFAEMLSCSTGFVSSVLNQKKRMPKSWIHDTPNNLSKILIIAKIDYLSDEKDKLKRLLTSKVNGA